MTILMRMVIIYTKVIIIINYGIRFYIWREAGGMGLLYEMVIKKRRSEMLLQKQGSWKKAIGNEALTKRLQLPMVERRVEHVTK
ncbi:hypothetical protein L1N85_10430 [Paenibacillus alkaliterrae]|uniref:hypothetical protein n=1 Tax=Paenibacillus alkaliterrae TaxID=320909 RepID=UPI001F16EACF|nr:hypothetical protein [Paenibacillus alkaliterrae]MCF2938852.1 hypothetical protein [Paenibacillus alkaliterrae]